MTRMTTMDLRAEHPAGRTFRAMRLAVFCGPALLIAGMISGCDATDDSRELRGRVLVGEQGYNLSLIHI